MAPKYTMSDSEEDNVVPTAPSDQNIEKGLRDGVAAVYKSGNMEELTVKRVRLAVEKKLGLTEGYFKSTGQWKARSEEVIRDEVERQDHAGNNAGPQSAEASPSPSPKPQKASLPKRAKADSMSKPRKRQKTKTPDSEEENEQDGDSTASDNSEEVTKPKKRTKAPVKKSAASKPKKVAPEVSDVAENESDASQPPAAVKDDSESEMSVVFDEEPQTKPARKRKSADGAVTKAKKASKAKDADLDPDQAEIKRLQGWLVKCGIRKLWGKELAPYDTSKAKIRHLREMLDDAGMKGRPSQEKANQIREERELKADLEQITQGAKQWGAKANEEEGDGDAKPRRRAARESQALAFLESDDEESD
ncbi:uncharacterized protein N7511_004550 [Penicillium nucicola]|uniref:uncharacterized protein n=1 Tax=Penicillium nucicola TaxID=1850975 RepID=UPI0025450A23|nr:uncharacterized protein N7511_004550 [Penicillium nucicola]KAJ5766934.1 hypothetical protein N7511_004550 [Penicillium nucicola]